MKKTILILYILFSTLSYSQKNNSHYKSDIDFGGGTIFTTFLDVSINKEQFKITSPENADVRMFGGKAKLGRLLGKSPKKGIIVNINGNIKNDSLFGDTKIPVFGELKFRGIIKNQNLSGVFLTVDGSEIGSVNGKVSEEKRLDFKFLYPIIIDTIQKNIYSKNELKTPEWEKFNFELKKFCNTVQDDIELYLGFRKVKSILPFTHMGLSIAQINTENSISISKDDEDVKEKLVVFEEKNKSTAYVKVKNFIDSKQELGVIFPQIIANQNYKNLIIDLRDNPGGGLDPAFELAKYITTKDIEVGYFITNKLKYSGFDSEIFNALPILQPKNNIEFTKDLKSTPGLKMVFKKPKTPVFTGTIYVLTNGRTGSTCEPIVYALKNNKMAIIIGEKTYGGMLAATSFVLSGKYALSLPIADFYTYDGVRLDKVGVTPDIEVKSDDALTKALEIIESNKL